jgi:catalase-peroxidase
MAMNDEETVALIAGGHTFGKAHGAGGRTVGPEPEARRSRSRAWAGRTSFGTGKGVTPSPAASKAPGPHPTKWTTASSNLFGYEWELTKSPAGATSGCRRTAPAPAPCPTRTTRQAHAPMMLTTDLALRFDPAYEKISRRFHETRRSSPTPSPRLVQADAPRHGPAPRYLGPKCRRRADLAGPGPRRRPPADRRADIAALKAKILASGLSVSELVAPPGLGPTFRGSDKRGGANGARIRLAPQKDWEVNQPAQLAKVLKALEGIQASSTPRKRRQEGLAGRPDRAGRLRRRRAGGAQGPATT